MSPEIASRLVELRATTDATYHVVSDNDRGDVLVFVVPTDMEPFFLVIDPAYLADSVPSVVH